MDAIYDFDNYKIQIEVTSRETGSSRQFEITCENDGRNTSLFAVESVPRGGTTRTKLSSIKHPRVTSVEQFFGVALVHRDVFWVDSEQRLEITVNEGSEDLVRDLIFPSEMFQEDSAQFEKLPYQVLVDREVIINNQPYLLCPDLHGYFCVSFMDYAKAKSNEICILQYGDEWRFTVGETNEGLFAKLHRENKEVYLFAKGHPGWTLARLLRYDLPKILCGVYEDLEGYNLCLDDLGILFERLDKKDLHQIHHFKQNTIIVKLSRLSFDVFRIRLDLDLSEFAKIESAFAECVISRASSNQIAKIVGQNINNEKHWRVEYNSPGALPYIISCQASSLIDLIFGLCQTFNVRVHSNIDELNEVISLSHLGSVHLVDKDEDLHNPNLDCFVSITYWKG